MASDKKKPTKSTTKAKKPKKVAKDADLSNYSWDGETWFDKNGDEVTHAGTLNILNNRAPTFKKGESGNPAGKPKGAKNRSTILRELMELTLKDKDGNNMKNPLDASQESMSVEVAISTALIKRALKGDVKAIQEIQDTLYGKVKNQNEFSGLDGKPFQVMLVDDIFQE